MPEPSEPAATRRGVAVAVIDEQGAVPIDAERWSTLAEAVLAAEGITVAAELSVLFVDVAAITELNERFMGVPGPTDVLAFPIDDAPRPEEPPMATLLLGDVVVCPAVAAQQAAGHAGTLDDELALLIVHGILHVLGHDHAEAEEASRMRRRERELLEQLHWGGPAPAAFRQEHAEG